MRWTAWRNHFERNAERPLPAVLDDAGVEGVVRTSLLRSLAVFQRGEAGEGRIAHEIDRVSLPPVDDDYRAALKLFVAEEGRHGRILGNILRAMGGAPLEHNWTERLFLLGRRLLGVRCKLVVLLAAEVVGGTFYRLIGARLHEGSVRRALAQIAADEEAHLRFHTAFFQAHCDTAARRLIFGAFWVAVCAAASFVVLVDHRRTMRGLKIPLRVAVGALCGGLRTTLQNVVLASGPDAVGRNFTEGPSRLARWGASGR